MAIHILLVEKLQILYLELSSRIFSESNTVHENAYSPSVILSPAMKENTPECGNWSLNMFMLLC